MKKIARSQAVLMISFVLILNVLGIIFSNINPVDRKVTYNDNNKFVVSNLDDNTIIEQVFINKGNRIKNISVMMATYMQEDCLGELNAELVNYESEEIIDTFKVNISDVEDNAYVDLEFDTKDKDVKDEKLILRISAKETGDKKVTLWANEYNTDETYAMVNGQAIGGSIIFSSEVESTFAGYKILLEIDIILIITFLGIYIELNYHLFRIIKNILKKINSILGAKRIYNIIVLVSGMIIVIYNVYRIQAFNSIGSKSVFIIFNCVLFLGVSYLIKNTNNIVKQFIIITALIGISFSIIVPPMQTPDEDVHWLRSYYLATGHIKLPSNLNDIPISFNECFERIGSFDLISNNDTKVNKKAFKEILVQPLNKQEVITYSKGVRTDSYLVFAYLPQSIGMAVGNILSLPPFWILLLGRITNLAVWCTVCSFALYLMPIKKQLLLAIMIMPMSISQAASLSPDAVLNASSFLIIAYVLNLKYREDAIKIKDYIILLVCSINIVSVKYPYLILLGLMLIVPKDRFNSNTKYQDVIKIISIIGIGLISLIIYIVLKSVSIEILPVGGNTVGVVDVVKDTIFHLNLFIKLVINNLKVNFGFYYQTMVARFGWLNIPMPIYIIKIYIIIVILVAIIHDDTENKLEVKNKIWLLCLFSGFIMLLIMVGILWSKTDWKLLTSVEGIQGRYFIPFIMCIPLTLYNIKAIKWTNKIKGFLTHNMYIVVLAMILIVSLDGIIYRYWA